MLGQHLYSKGRPHRVSEGGDSLWEAACFGHWGSMWERETEVQRHSDTQTPASGGCCHRKGRWRLRGGLDAACQHCLVWSVWGKLAALTFNSVRREPVQGCSQWATGGPGEARQIGSAIMEQETTYPHPSTDRCREVIPAWGPCSRSHSRRC